MEISRALSTDLDLLTDALNDPRADLVDTLRQLAHDTLAAVPSFLGLSLVVTGRDAPTTFVLLPAEARTAIATSLLLPLLRAGDLHGSSVSVVLYAARPGSFVDLAADLSWLTGIGSFALDEHLVPPPAHVPAGTLRAESTINQAVGVLLSLGMTPEVAERHLEELAVETGTDRSTAAETVLRIPTAPRPDLTPEPAADLGADLGADLPADPVQD